jgi:uncharacterized protein (TIGR02246 family)
MLPYGLLLGLVGFLAGCNTAPPDTRDADIQALKDTEAAWVKDAATKDPDKFAAHYTEDASVLLPNAPIITGKPAITGALKQIMTDPNFSLQFGSTRQDVGKGGDLGYTVGAYTMTLTNPKDHKPVTDKGKYMTIFRKQTDGSWKAVSDMLNSDMAAPVEAPSK